jgi:hypothetical protein
VLTNDDDYVRLVLHDRTNQDYIGRVGAGNSAIISIQPFTVVAN